MTDVVVVSIFVNRLQFLSEDEYQRYPRDITRDVDLLRDESVDYVFTPPEDEMYPEGFSTYVVVENYGRKLPELQRSTYFRGMTTSVAKLLHIVKPGFIFFGQKDGLQGAILQKMMRDLNIDTEVVVRPVVRDASGLAFAARNFFLTESEKAAASVLYRSLKAAEEDPQGGDVGHRRRTPGTARVRHSRRRRAPGAGLPGPAEDPDRRRRQDRRDLAERLPPDRAGFKITPRPGQNYPSGVNFPIIPD
ncbi:MAG: hypothetical protein DMG07_25605 [Acidobacteria bacterium]|nr:MAG: hypothetical protein DMG07_25605 [Acidobacteriota bacterium]